MCEQCAVSVVLLSRCAAQILHTVFVFSNHQTEYGERWFLIFRTLRCHFTTSPQSSFKTAGTGAMFTFVFVIFGLPLRCASSIDFSPTANQLCHQNTVACDMDESSNAFTNISHVFAAVNPALQQNFITACCSKFFFMVIYNRSTVHTILQNALIPPHMDGLISNLVCRWRRV